VCLLTALGGIAWRVGVLTEEKKQLTNMPFNRGGLADYYNIALIAAYIHCLQIPFLARLSTKCSG